MSDECAWAEGQLWRVERQLWLEDRAARENMLAPFCMMALSSDVMGRLEALEAFDRGPQWASVIFAQQRLERPADDLIVLGYVAVAAGPRTLSYLCCCTSTYRAIDNDWKLIQHQQAPVIDAI